MMPQETKRESIRIGRNTFCNKLWIVCGFVGITGFNAAFYSVALDILLELVENS